ncbi:MAG: Na+/H+ antiporter [Xanthobacteraceae bacterium]
MTATIETILLLLAVLVVVAVAARRLDIAPSILLVVAGIVLALIPGLPRIELAPELVLLGILPPLIYSAGVAMSWREFRFNLRPIALFAFGCVVFTTCAVAAAAHFVLGMPLALGFVLGAIVAPPDSVAPLAIVRRLGVPRRLVVILEGEGLANDATALILYRFAVAAVSTGLFSFGTASGEFAVIVIGEIAYGIAIGWLSLRLRRWAGDPRVEITLSLLTPYVAFLLPEQLGGSGVLATVAAGLFVSWNGPLLIPAATRLQGIFFWDLVVYLLEGFVFLVTGMQTRTVFIQLHGVPWHHFALAILLTVAVVIATRFTWVYPAALLPRWLNPSLARRDPLPPWRWLFLLGFVGVRGVVSLAAALAIPLYTAAGTPFPDRDLILFVTFGVIVVTLIGQGSLLPALVRWLKLDEHAASERQREHEAELAARSGALDLAQGRLQQLLADGRITPEAHAILYARHEYRAGRLSQATPDGIDAAAAAAEVRMELIAAERDYIYRLLQDGKITDEARRRIERELDLEEASVACKREGGQEPPL